MTIFEQLIYDPRKLQNLAEVFAAFGLAIVQVPYGKKFEIVPREEISK